MKSIPIKSINSFYGKPIKCPSFDESGDPVMEDNKRDIREMDGTLIKEPVVVDANVANLIDYMIRVFPREKLTIHNISIAMKIRDRLVTAHTGELVFEDAEYEWIIKFMKDDSYGVKLFGMDLPNVLTAMGSQL